MEENYSVEILTYSSDNDHDRRIVSKTGDKSCNIASQVYKLCRNCFLSTSFPSFNDEARPRVTIDLNVSKKVYGFVN